MCTDGGTVSRSALQQLIPYGTIRCLASADVGPDVLVCVPSDFINLAGKLKADVGAAHGYALGTEHNVTGTKHIALVGTEELEKDHPTLRSGRSQDVPSYKAAVKQRRVNNDVSLYNGKIKDWSRIHNPSLF